MAATATVWTLEDEIAWNLNSPFRQHLGMQVEEVRPEGIAVISMVVTDNLLQAYRVVHGGIHCVLIDTVLGAAVRAGYGRDVKALTTDLNVSFLRPSGLGQLVAKAEMIKMGRTIAVGHGEVLDAQGRQVAVGRGSFMVTTE